MRHLKIGRKFNRTPSHRRAMFANMSNSVLKYELIKTTVSKAKELRRFLEPIINLAKQECLLRKAGSDENLKTRIVSLRRKANSYLRNDILLKKLFEKIGPRYESRPGGYLRILKCGVRFGDKAPMAYVQLLDK